MNKSGIAKIAGIGISLLVLGTVGVAVSGAFSSSGPASPGPEPTVGQAVPNGGISSPSVAQSAAFSAFRRSRDASDEVATSPEALRVLYSPQTQYDANPSLGRQVAANVDGTSILVPGDKMLCLVAEMSEAGAASACVSDSEAESNGVGIVAYGPNGYSAAGVLPDGASQLEAVSESGVTAPVELTSDNGYVITTPWRPVAFTWIGADGAKHRQAQPAPPPPTPPEA